MFTISDSIYINAPIERCFLLSTNIELVGKTLGMKPIEGKTSGLIVANDKLLWAGWKFGLPQMHESVITRYERPSFFQDTMERGRFKRYQHEHYFYEMDERTVLNDKVRFTMPLGIVGRLVGRFVLVPYISRRLRRRLVLLRKVAENRKEWEKYLPEDNGSR
ncbi:MAG TPA: SRPBCC family protein [Edaphobacter sp.]|jgi:ligand-binding SRPBCC domain-containing protein|nr:SRPBCC family protein [Edaphobacter sp.]